MLKLMPNTILSLLITLYSIALHGRKSHYKNAEEKNNAGLKSLKVIEAMLCDSIKRTLSSRKEGEAQRGKLNMQLMERKEKQFNVKKKKGKKGVYVLAYSVTKHQKSFYSNGRTDREGGDVKWQGETRGWIEHRRKASARTLFTNVAKTQSKHKEMQH